MFFQLPAGEIIDLVGRYFGQFGYPLIFLSAFLENIAIINYFTPGSTVIWIAGFYAQQGLLNPFLVWITAAAAATLGNQIDYLLGYSGIYHLIRVFNLEKRVEEQKRKYVRKENIIEAFLIYMIGLIRSFLLVALGALRIPWPKYFIFTATCAAFRKGLFVAIGYFFGTNRPFIEWFFSNFWWMGLALLLLWVIFRKTIFKYGQMICAKIKGK
ncbi:hypothetical protein COT70_01610 [candidate division WWE3 bacterium CG09_land_8_20_14_0_10_47_33]|uniref:VTT domain-containing protein n=1 Tax=candidate division WWE3 bacterium CG_4_9_14_0_2_um_filter_48_10 TaxID=1975078 RepID=A0A2M8EJC6_UNCKA|nr:MAG: hypothetical protein COT70_01610 [candidate division WWE3 bacterium CG09_land_8_20_14_0_10_47_33]PIZ41527.1 MAG: hypothetical protein COY35_00195 [candidate division WWE3 bacterium CG_4_10_14_0_2_um_filter_47_8]PJC22849.1 MAG: hypothetical protein CO059_01570 [candidate division WWE3 bacterium CG_4_9_14_0_2_um_filter_48_10]PJE51878.1 MAG: hypothetical protein COV28_01555 [candidate division WWE3 bacterium CG10_big_fil_rev_8_21_14_0_10_48_23]